MGFSLGHPPCPQQSPSCPTLSTLGICPGGRGVPTRKAESAASAWALAAGWPRASRFTELRAGFLCAFLLWVRRVRWVIPLLSSSLAYPEISMLVFCFFFFCHPKHMEFLDQGLGLSHSWNLRCSCDNTGSLIPCAGPGIEHASPVLQRRRPSHFATVGTPTLVFYDISRFGLAVAMPRPTGSIRETCFVFSRVQLNLSHVSQMLRPSSARLAL